MVSRFWRKKDIGVGKEIAKGLFGREASGGSAQSSI